MGIGESARQQTIFEKALTQTNQRCACGDAGPNAVRVLKALGVLDEVIAHSDDSGPTMRSFQFIYGTGECETVYTVRIPKASIPLGHARTHENGLPSTRRRKETLGSGSTGNASPHCIPC